MRAIILAAGIGSRLRPITDHKPKTMVEVNGCPMLGYILNALKYGGIKEVTICTGYKADVIEEYCRQKYSEMSITYILNPDYESTNNMYSLYLARKDIHGDFLLMNADLVFDPIVIRKLINQQGTLVAVDVGTYNEESMKLDIRENGTIKEISKKIEPDRCFGSSIDVYKICASDVDVFLKRLEYYIEVKNEKKQWTEVLLNDLFSSGIISALPCNINPSRWFEIDNYEDLAKAEILFNSKLNELQNRKLFFIDRDGTLTINDTAIPGASEFWAKLKDSGKMPFVLTNNSSRTPEEHAKVMNNIGIPAKKSDILLSTDSCLNEFRKLGIKRIFWLANKNVSDYIEYQGFLFDDSEPQALMLTYDDQITYSDLVMFSRLVRKGYPYYATHIDVVCPTTSGPIPDIGCFIETIAHTTGKHPIKTFGKPALDLVYPILESKNLKFSDAVVIGDRLYTDISMAAGTELISILVLTGETDRSAYEMATTRADIIVPSVSSLLEYL